MSFTLPRYNPRLVVMPASFEGDDEEPYVWFANFDSNSTFSVGWPLTAGVLKSQLGLMGIMTVRRR